MSDRTGSIGYLKALGGGKHFVDITPANTDLAVLYNGVMTKTAGDVVARNHNNVDTTFVAVPAFTVLPISPKQIRTGTTASVVGLV